MNEFFSTNANSRARGAFDNLLLLRDYDAAAIAATTSETGIEFPVRKTNSYKVILSIDAYTGYSADTIFWTITVEISNLIGGTFYTVGTFIPDGNAIETEIPLTGGWCATIDSDSEFIRVTATATDDLETPSLGELSYGAWIIPS